jgi:hypothetical protein
MIASKPSQATDQPDEATDRMVRLPILGGLHRQHGRI